VSELTHDHVDDAFHEIQLSGKQLVFLFMATTVVSVFIFLCGVLVGRGVRAEDIGVDSTVATSGTPVPVTERQPVSSPPAAVAEQPAPAADSALTYADRLQRDKPASEDLKARAAAPKEEPRATEEQRPKLETPRSEPLPVATPAAAAPPPAAAATAGARPGAWAVQVVSLRDRAQATKIVQRLSGKGYPASLIPPAAGAPAQVYKVQVGRYDDRQEAQRVSERLKKEEQFDPWIIR
jgi:cell division septation protein DedD